MKKFIRQLTIFSLIFIMTFSVGFSSQKGINVQAATTQTTATNDGKLRKNGVLFTGISDNKYYKPYRKRRSDTSGTERPFLYCFCLQPDGKTGRVTATT